MLTHCKGMMKTRTNHITKQSLSLAALKNSWKCSCFFNIHILSIRCVDQSTFIDAAASLCKRENLIDNIARLFSEKQPPANSWWLHSQKARSWNAIKKKRWIVFQATLLVSTSFAETFHWCCETSVGFLIVFVLITTLLWKSRNTRHKANAKKSKSGRPLYSLN